MLKPVYKTIVCMYEYLHSSKTAILVHCFGKPRVDPVKFQLVKLKEVPTNVKPSDDGSWQRLPTEVLHLILQRNPPHPGGNRT